MAGLVVVLGYLIGSVPSADWIARAAGIDLRAGGSRNPGANNARSLGGTRLAAAVLGVEMSKGAAAVILGSLLAGSVGGALAGLGALAGNVFNVWYRFQGGQGLGISAGILIAAWPVWFPAVLTVIAVVTPLTRTTARAALAALATILLGVVLELRTGMPSAWGIGSAGLPILAMGMVALIAPKQIAMLARSDHAPVDGLDDQRDGPLVQ